MASVPARSGIFYGWFILATSFFALFVSTGARNTFGVFILPMTDDFGWSRGAISAAIAIGWLINGLTQPLLGSLYDRWGGRIVITISLAVLGVFTVLMSQINSLWSLILVYGFIMSIASGGVSMVTVHAVLSKWFFRRRGVVLSIGAAGGTAGSMVLAPFATYLILLAGWRFTYGVLGFLILALALPLAYFMIRDTPEEMGEVPDGRNSQKPAEESGSGPRVTSEPGPLDVDRWQQSFQSPPVWQMAGAYFVCGMTTAIISAHYVPFAVERGASPGTAALAFGLMTGLNVAGVIGVGFLSDRLERKYLLGAVYTTRGLAYAMLILAPGMIGIWGFAVIAGLSWVASASLTSALTADIYGLKTIGTLNGITTLVHQVGGALSVFLGGLLYDVFGSYDVPFSIAGLMLVGASIASFSIREKKFSSRYQRATPAVASAGDGD